jgi:hypothetical protein
MMGNFMENLYDVLFRPAAAMRQIAAARLTGQAAAAFLLGVLIPAGAAYFAFRTGVMAKLLTIILVGQTVGSLLIWFCGSAVLSLIAEFFGGRGTAVGLFAAMGFTHVPRIFAVPFLVLAMLLPDGGSALVTAITSLAIVCWTLTLDVLAISGAHELSSAKAVLVLMTPLLVVGAAVIIVLVLAGTAFLPGWIW